MALKRAEPDSAERVWTAFTEFWTTEGSAHFIEEETELIPAYVRVADPAHPAVIRTLLEHALIRARVAAIDEQDEPDVSDLNELGIWLDLHVRHEERVLFPLIEDATGVAAT